MFQVLLGDSLDADSEGRLAAAARVVRPAAPGEAGLIQAIGECDALIVRTNTRVTRAILTAGRKLRVVGVAGVGVENVDEAAAREAGIQVINTPGASSDAVAELTVAFMLQLLRPIPRLMAEYRANRFAAARAWAHGVELRELTIGIIGVGRIGSRVARICSAGFGCRVLANDIRAVGPFSFPVEMFEKERIWREADMISLHVPLTDATRGLINADVLGRFRSGARLINTCRGGVIVTDALVAALHAGRLAGVALDVTDPEPLASDHQLFSMPNVVLTPHIAARTVGGLQRMYAVVDDVIRALRGEPRNEAM